MPHGTPGLSRRERFAARLLHYAAFTLFFLLLYGGIRFWLGRFPKDLLVGVLVASLAKDLIDEVLLALGRAPLAYAGVEHAPSNAILLGFLATGVVEPTGSLSGVPVTYWAGGLAALDLVLDLSQDLRAEA